MHLLLTLKTRWLVLVLQLATLALLSLTEVPTVARANHDVTYYPETAHYVTGLFKDYWDKNGALEQYGYPLTEAFYEKSPTDGKTYITQYFQRAIFEYHPELAGTKYAVLLRLVGNLETAGRVFPPATVTASRDSLLYFPQTRHTLDGVYRSYWEKWGGLMVYGYPISETLTELNPADNKTYTVQYFERGRLEYHLEFKGTRYEVLLGLLGWQQLVATVVPEEVKVGQPKGRENIYSGPGLSGAPLVLPGLPAGNGASTGGKPNPTSGPALPPATITPLRIDGLGYGMNVWLFGQDMDRVLGLVKEAGFGWIRQQVGWDALEPGPGQFNWDELDRIVEATNRLGVKTFLSLVRAPRWAGIAGTSGLPSNPATFGNVIGLMAARYKGRVAAYEVWNEQNLSLETGGRVEIAPYVETLKAGYKAVKAADPGAIVIYGGLSPTGVNDKNAAIDDALYLEQSYQYNNGEMRNYFDVLGVHPGSQANSPDEFWPKDAPADKSRPWTTHPSFYFRRIEDMRAIMEKYGDGNKQMWLTEFGWTTKNPAPGYEYGAYINEETQARYLVRAYERAKSQYPWIGVMALWQLNFATFVGAEDEKGPWGILRPDWSPRPAYDALKAMPK